jgi:hypothetical protein
VVLRHGVGRLPFVNLGFTRPKNVKIFFLEFKRWTEVWAETCTCDDSASHVETKASILSSLPCSVSPGSIGNAFSLESEQEKKLHWYPWDSR